MNNIKRQLGKLIEDLGDDEKSLQKVLIFVKSLNNSGNKSPLINGDFLCEYIRGNAILFSPWCVMGYYYSIYHFVDCSKKVAVHFLLVPVIAHGIYDALVMSSMVNPYVGGVAFIILIYFCVKMHKVARGKS